MNSNPTIARQLLDGDKQKLKEIFVDNKNAMAYLLERPRCMREISCDGVGAIAAMNLFSKIEKSPEKIVDCAMAIMVAVMSLKLLIISNDLSYYSATDSTEETLNLSDFRLFPVSNYIIDHLSQVYSQDVAESFMERCLNYYYCYNTNLKFVTNELDLEGVLTDRLLHKTGR